MRAHRVTALLFTALWCSGAGAATIPRGATILPAGQTDALLRQCSRAAPSQGGPTWRPGVADILALETLLPKALARRTGQAPSGLDRWRRQYVGVVRGGRRIVYGNFFLRQASPPADSAWRARPVVVCDGGAGFFGVEYDADARRIVRLAFNGPA